MRTLLAGTAALLVLVALWPVTCVSTGGGPETDCTSLVLVPLPWRDNADTWGIVVALAAAALAFLLISRVRRPRG